MAGAGVSSFRGWWSYYPVTLLYRVPVPILLLFLLRAITALCDRWRGVRAPESPFLLLFPALILLVFSASPTQLGERYILLAYPPLFVWIGGLARVSFPSPWKPLGAALLAAWLVVGTARIPPHYLMYFNEIAGGPTQGWKTVHAGAARPADPAARVQAHPRPRGDQHQPPRAPLLRLAGRARAGRPRRLLDPDLPAPVMPGRCASGPGETASRREKRRTVGQVAGAPGRNRTPDPLLRRTPRDPDE